MLILVLLFRNTTPGGWFKRSAESRRRPYERSEYYYHPLKFIIIWKFIIMVCKICITSRD